MKGNTRIETEEEIDDYIAKMKYALDHGASINFCYVLPLCFKTVYANNIPLS